MWVISYLGGPLAAGYIIASNYRAFGQKRNSTKTLIFTLLATVIVFCVALFVPFGDKFPNLLIPVIYTAIAYGLMQWLQGDAIAAYIGLGGKLYGWGHNICIGLIGAVITVGMVLVVPMNTVPASLTVKKYYAMEHEIYFEKNNISEDKVDSFARLFRYVNFFDDEQTKYVYIYKSPVGYEISISIIRGAENNDEITQLYVEFREVLQSFYNDNTVVINLIDGVGGEILKRIE